MGRNKKWKRVAKRRNGHLLKDPFLGCKKCRYLMECVNEYDYSSICDEVYLNNIRIHEQEIKKQNIDKVRHSNIDTLRGTSNPSFSSILNAMESMLVDIINSALKINQTSKSLEEIASNISTNDNKPEGIIITTNYCRNPYDFESSNELKFKK